MVDLSDRITAVVATSPIELLPESYIGTVVESIHERLPDVRVVVAADGVRPEQAHLARRYGDYLQEVARSDVTLVCLPEWGHQANTIRAALDHVTTPYLLYTDHDLPLAGPTPDYVSLCGLLLDGQADLIRFSVSPRVPDVYERLMIDHETQVVNGAPVRRTRMWGQPHLATRRFYERMLWEHFPLSSRTTIEDRMTGSFRRDRGDWEAHRLWLYHPDGDICRAEHLDGRGGVPRGEMRFI